MLLLKGLVLSALLSLSVNVLGSHIVGGEFRMVHINGFQYRFDLIIYFDLQNGAPGAKDASVMPRIFRGSDNKAIMDLTMPLTTESSITSLHASCVSSYVNITELIYSTTVTLQPDIFNDEAGYYIVWERCCRNYVISNIYSDPPGSGIQPSGQTFYLKFPPVIKNDRLFINSTPKLSRPFADYTCVGYPYFADFSGQDVDDDSLVYSIVTPWSTHTADALPINGPLPKPYPEVTWRPSFSLQHVMGGNSTLGINREGIVSVVPPLVGLFSFAVKCEEYRDGIKIGELIRDFQIFSLSCPVQTPPSISARTAGGSYSDESIDVHFDNSVTDANRCVQVKVSDVDIATSSQNIRIQAILIGSGNDVSGILPVTASATLSQASPSAEFSICFDRCPPTAGNIFQVGIVAYDASCAVPLTDTIRIHVTMDIPAGECMRQTISFPSIGDKELSEGQFALDATASSGLPVNYSISNNNIASVSSSSVMMLQPGLITITATQQGNIQYLPANPIKRSLCINPQPPTLTYASNGTDVVIQSSSAVGNLWYIDGVLQHNVTASSIPLSQAPGSYTYSARLLIDNCLSEASQPLVITVTAINDPVVMFYPNPVEDKLFYKIESNELGRTFWLRDMLGHVILEDSLQNGLPFIDMSELGAGVYLLSVFERSGVTVQKIIKR